MCNLIHHVGKKTLIKKMVIQRECKDTCFSVHFIRSFMKFSINQDRKDNESLKYVILFTTIWIK